MRAFLDAANNQLVILQQSIVDLQELQKQCCELYAERNTEGMLAKFADFRKALGEAHTANLFQQKSEQRKKELTTKKAKRQKQMEDELAQPRMPIRSVVPPSFDLSSRQGQTISMPGKGSLLTSEKRGELVAVRQHLEQQDWAELHKITTMVR